MKEPINALLQKIRLMKRAIPTFIFSICLIALYMTFMIGVQSCGNKKDVADDAANLGDKVEEMADTFTEDNFFEDETSEEEDAATTEYQDNEEDNGSYTSTSSTTSSPTAPTARSYAASSGQGAYWIVAGNYLLEDNADIMVSKLKKQGYRDAEKVIFDLSQYYTVIAARFTTRSKASQVGSTLKGQGFDNYVVTKK